MWLLTVRDLLFRKRQFAIAVFGSALVFAMALVLAGLSGGFRGEVRRTVEATQADGFVVAAGTSGPFTSVATLPEGTLAGIRGATAADPLITVRQTAETPDGRIDINLIGHVRGGLGEPPVRSGRRAIQSGEAVADRRTGLRTGDSLRLGGRAFTVVGETKGLSYLGGIPVVFVGIDDARTTLFAGAPVATTIAVRGTPTLPPGVHLISAREARADALRPLANGIRSIDNCVRFLWVVAAVIIGAVSYLSALERLRDFAVLKAVGVGGDRLYAGLALQSTLMALAAAVVALAVSRVLVPLFPIPIDIPASAFAILPLVAVLVGLLASLSGLRQAVRVDPALAFAGR